MKLTHKEWRKLRGHDVSMIFQDSGAMMNQTRLIGDSYVEYILTHEDISRKDAWAKGVEMIERMRLPDGDRVIREPGDYLYYLPEEDETKLVPHSIHLEEANLNDTARALAEALPAQDAALPQVGDVVNGFELLEKNGISI